MQSRYTRIMPATIVAPARLPHGACAPMISMIAFDGSRRGSGADSGADGEVRLGNPKPRFK
jgi:hypothetical protein